MTALPAESLLTGPVTRKFIREPVETRDRGLMLFTPCSVMTSPPRNRFVTEPVQLYVDSSAPVCPALLTLPVPAKAPLVIDWMFWSRKISKLAMLARNPFSAPSATDRTYSVVRPFAMDQ